ncbi:MAG: hypothetical protein ABIJ97_13460 [Bacteroidota bacterium]
MELSGAQKIVKLFSSATKFEKMMEESKQWKFTCDCGKESSIWDIGGIRAGAKGKPSITVKCPYCNKISMQKIYREQ